MYLYGRIRASLYFLELDSSFSPIFTPHFRRLFWVSAGGGGGVCHLYEWLDEWWMIFSNIRTDFNFIVGQFSMTRKLILNGRSYQADRPLALCKCSAGPSALPVICQCGRCCGERMGFHGVCRSFKCSWCAGHLCGACARGGEFSLGYWGDQTYNWNTTSLIKRVFV